MSTTLKFVILTHISSKVGYGHLNRCIILGKEIKKRGNEISLIVAGKKDDVNFFANYNWIKFFGKKKIKFPSADICIVDNYCYKNEYYKKLRAFYDKILIFDDYKYIVPNYVSGVINPNLYADKKLYCPGIRLFAGRKYLLIRNEFFNINRKKNSNRILLCVGGSDPENQMDRLLLILTKVSKRPIDAVFGPGFENLNVIKRWKHHPGVFTHKAVKTISKLMSKAFYALSSSGSMIYELTAAGVPTICMALAENQKLIGEHFSKLNLVAYLGLFKEINNKKIENKLKIFEKGLENNNGKFSEKKIILLNGAKNLAKDLEKWTFLKKKKFMSPYSKKEIEFEYNLSAKMKKEHDKVHWGSKKSMYNRYNFVMKELPFLKAKNWLDVGSGIGSFQYLISKNFSKIKAVGLELSSELIKVARKKKILNTKFYQTDFIEYKKKKYDLLTCLGVISKTNFGLNDFFNHAANLVKENGLIMVDFKNSEWSKFKKSGFFPDSRHLWFTKKQIIQSIKKNNLFRVIKLVGYLPNRNKLVDIPQSHVIFLIARRTNNKLI